MKANLAELSGQPQAAQPPSEMSLSVTDSRSLRQLQLQLTELSPPVAPQTRSPHWTTGLQAQRRQGVRRPRIIIINDIIIIIIIIYLGPVEFLQRGDGIPVDSFLR